ncbi:MAG: hypothetical protein EOO27_02280 [Comamonadaceae bacterium]|nr:MAG: hypothetical protein EOO27_02280 [Comamonadaceae bacterium]
MTKKLYIAYKISLLDQSSEQPNNKSYEMIEQADDESTLAERLIARGVAGPVKVQECNVLVTDDSPVESIVSDLQRPGIEYESPTAYRESFDEGQ